MSTNPTDQTDRDAKRADQLTVGDHVIEQPAYERELQPMRVNAAQPFLNGNRSPRVALMLDALDGGEPMYVTVKPEKPYELADEQDLAAFREVGTRHALAKALHQLADDIVGSRPPLSSYLSFSGVLDSAADVEAWARVLDGTMVSRTGYPVVDVARGPLRIHVQGPKLPQPEPAEPEQEWLFTFGAGQQHDGRFVRITGTYDSARSRMNLVFGHAWCAQYDWQRFDEEGLPARVTELPESEWPPHADDAQPTPAEHRHVGGDGGMPGECSAECACGVTFDGFDTIAEATALLDRHIANPDPSDDEIAEPQTREIKARYLTAGMTVIDGTDGPLVVTVVNRYTAHSNLVYFEGQPEPTMFGLEVGVIVAVDDAQAGE